MFGLGLGEILVVLLIALIFIGPKKLPELAKGLGKGIRDFQNAAKGFSDQLEESVKEQPKSDGAQAPQVAHDPQQNEASTSESDAETNKTSHS
jgi:sec-independent protein translocase protein TatA